MLITRYACNACGHTLYAPVELFLTCPACESDTGDVVQLVPIKKFGPVPGFSPRVPADEKLKIILQTRLSQGISDRVDAVRGQLSRSEWLRARLVDWLDEADWLDEVPPDEVPA